MKKITSINDLIPPREPETTGKYLVLLQEEADIGTNIQSLRDSAGISSVVQTSDFESGALDLEEIPEEGAAIFDKLNVAVCSLNSDQLESMNAACCDEKSTILAVEEERVIYAIGSDEYLKGYRDGIEDMSRRLIEGEEREEEEEFINGKGAPGQGATWGLQATGVVHSKYSGRGIRLAVLDTGMDLKHPDFAGRAIIHKSFIPGESAQDINDHGHGTHCIGTACGGLNASLRYGVAYNAEIYVGKVLGGAKGRGKSGSVLAGIDWAIKQQCQIVSMSLGAQPSKNFSQIHEKIAQRAMKNGTLLIAAAGNESNRPSYIAPVSHPANCPSIMAVAALDSRLSIAPFSCGGLNPTGGQVDIAGPGVSVYSSVPMPTRYNSMSGTSMATPHVAGIAALVAEAFPYADPQALWGLLTRNAIRLSISSRDAGSGLVVSP